VLESDDADDDGKLVYHSLCISIFHLILLVFLILLSLLLFMLVCI
jgi:hypothetical protein